MLYVYRLFYIASKSGDLSCMESSTLLQIILMACLYVVCQIVINKSLQGDCSDIEDVFSNPKTLQKFRESFKLPLQSLRLLVQNAENGIV